MRALEDKTFLWLVIAVSLAFAWVLLPFYGAVLWAVVVAVLFAPLYRWLVRVLRQRRSLAALATLVIVVVIVILPLTLVVAALVQEVYNVYAAIQSGQLNFGRIFQQLFNALPDWAVDLLDRFELTNLAAVQERLSASLVRGTQLVAQQAVALGQHTFDFGLSLFVMLYLLFFLLRDGAALSRRIEAAIPLRTEQKRALLEKFIVVIRATVKGNVIIALLQGALGGLIFWLLGLAAPLLWAVLMALLSLLPAVGSALIWFPVAVYLLVTGAVWQGIVLIAYGVLVIGLVDNFLRPILVGKDTKMPDYVVLISTLGGLALFGVHGFVLGPVIAALFLAAWAILSAPEQPAR